MQREESASFPVHVEYCTFVNNIIDNKYCKTERGN